jgi:hypothetical protein
MAQPHLLPHLCRLAAEVSADVVIAFHQESPVNIADFSGGFFPLHPPGDATEGALGACTTSLSEYPSSMSGSLPVEDFVAYSGPIQVCAALAV